MILERSNQWLGLAALAQHTSLGRQTKAGFSILSDWSQFAPLDFQPCSLFPAGTGRSMPPRSTLLLDPGQLREDRWTLCQVRGPSKRPALDRSTGFGQ